MAIFDSYDEDFYSMGWEEQRKHMIKNGLKATPFKTMDEWVDYRMKGDGLTKEERKKRKDAESRIGLQPTIDAQTIVDQVAVDNKPLWQQMMDLDSRSRTAGNTARNVIDSAAAAYDQEKPLIFTDEQLLADSHALYNYYQHQLEAEPPVTSNRNTIQKMFQSSLLDPERQEENKAYDATGQLDPARYELSKHADQLIDDHWGIIANIANSGWTTDSSYAERHAANKGRGHSPDLWHPYIESVGHWEGDAMNWKWPKPVQPLPDKEDASQAQQDYYGPYDTNDPLSLNKTISPMPTRKPEGSITPMISQTINAAQEPSTSILYPTFKEIKREPPRLRRDSDDIRNYIYGDEKISWREAGKIKNPRYGTK